MKFKYFHYLFFVRDPAMKSPERKSKDIVKDSVYETNITKKELVKKFHFIHYVFKYKFLIPGIWLLKKILGKKLVKEVDNEPHNTNLRIFNEAFEETMKKATIIMNNKRMSKEEALAHLEKQKNSGYGSEAAMESLKNILLTIVTYDTYYREILNILMHEIAQRMLAEYGDKKKYPKGTTHLLYNSKSAYDVFYKQLHKVLKQEVNLSLADAMERVDLSKLQGGTESGGN